MISIILLILSLIGSIYFGKELFLKENPIAIASLKDFDTVRPLHLNFNNFEIYSAVEYANYTYYNDPRVFTFDAYEEDLSLMSNGRQNVTIKKLEMKQCKEYYKQCDLNLDTNLFHCIKPNTTTVEGYWGSSVNKYVRIKLLKCTNSTENDNHCYSENYIDSLIQGGIVNMFIKNSMLQLSNYETPVTYEKESHYFSLNTDFTFTLAIQVRELLFQTDKGYLLTDIDEVKGFYFDTPKLLYFGKRDRLLAEITVQTKPRGQVIYRQYVKFQDVITKIGGLIKVFMIIGNFISAFVANIEFHINFIFNLKYKLDFKPIENKRDVDLIFNNMLKNNSLSNTRINKNVIKINNIVHKVEEKQEAIIEQEFSLHDTK